MKVKVYTLWASMKDEEDPSPWMIAAEDEFSWEGDPQRCEQVFAEARRRHDSSEIREITLEVEWDAVAAAFLPAEVAAEVAT